MKQITANIARAPLDLEQKRRMSAARTPARQRPSSVRGVHLDYAFGS